MLQETLEPLEIQVDSDNTYQEILAFLAFFFCLILVAVVISNLGGFTKLANCNINPSLFFDHQATEYDDWKPKQKPTEYQTNLRLNLRQSLRGIDEIVSTAKWSDPAEVNLMDGSLSIVYEDLPQGDWPLCIDQEWLDDYEVVVYSYGGYEPVSGMSYIKVTQGSERWNFNNKMKEYYIWVEWTKITGECGYEKDCCADEWYRGTFKIYLDKLCFDAENYPVAGIPDDNWAKWKECSPEIPGKDVTWYFNTTWSGCSHEDQYFSIMSIREYSSIPP